MATNFKLQSNEAAQKKPKDFFVNIEVTFYHHDILYLHG